MSTSFFPRSPLQSGFALVNINHCSFPGLELERANSSFFFLFIFPFASPYAVTDRILKCIVLRPHQTVLRCVSTAASNCVDGVRFDC